MAPAFGARPSSASASGASSDRAASGAALGLWAVLALALAVRLIGLDQTGVWSDEVYPLTLAAQPMMEGMVGALRFDLHPPLYILQLHLWGLIGLGQADGWMHLNSVAWSVGAVGALYAAVRARHGARAAFWAALFLALMPREVEYAQTARMYAMLTALIVLAWAAQNRMLRAESTWRAAALFVLAGAAVAYTHATGFFALAFIGLFGLIELRGTGAARPAWRRFAVAQGLVAALCLPVLGNAAVRSTVAPPLPGIGDLGWTVVYQLIGPEGGEVGPLAAAAGVLVAGLALAVWRLGAARAEFLLLVLAPMAALALVSYAVKPAWHSRNLIVILPFLALAAGVVVARLTERANARTTRGGTAGSAFRPAGLLAGALGALVLTLALPPYYSSYAKPNDFQAAGRTVAETVRAGDVVYAPRNHVFWGLVREEVGPKWGSPLAVQDMAESPRWQGIYRRLGRPTLELLGLAAKSRVVRDRGVTFVVGPSPHPAVAGARRLWLVEDPSSDGVNTAGLPSLRGFWERRRVVSGGLVLRLMVRGFLAGRPPAGAVTGPFLRPDRAV